MFFKKKEKVDINNNLIEICALLIHAAKIDEHFSEKEEKIIKQTMLKIGVKKDHLDELFNEAIKIEDNLIELNKSQSDLGSNSTFNGVSGLYIDRGKNGGVTNSPAAILWDDGTDSFGDNDYFKY